MYSSCNEGKSAVAERFIKTLKNNIYKHMTALSKNVCFNILNDTVYKYNNTLHRTIKMKPADVTSDYFVECNEKSNEKDSKFKIAGHEEFQSIKKILLIDMLLIGQMKFFIRKTKNTIPWTYANNDLNGEEIIGTF